MSIVKVIVESYTFETVPQRDFIASFQVIGKTKGTLADQEGCRFGANPDDLTTVTVPLNQSVSIDDFDANSFIIYRDGSGSNIRWRPQSVAVYGVDASNTRHLLCNVLPWPANAPWIGVGPDAVASVTLGQYSQAPTFSAKPSSPRVCT